MILKAKIKTKSNFRNLNGQWLEVREMKVTRVTCRFINEINEIADIDFTLQEIEEFDYEKPKPTNNALLQLTHDTSGPANRIKSLVKMLKKRIAPDDFSVEQINEENKMLDMITQSADDVNTAVDAYYKEVKE